MDETPLSRALGGSAEAALKINADLAEYVKGSVGALNAPTNLAAQLGAFDSQLQAATKSVSSEAFEKIQKSIDAMTAFNLEAAKGVPSGLLKDYAASPLASVTGTTPMRIARAPMVDLDRLERRQTEREAELRRAQLETPKVLGAILESLEHLIERQDAIIERQDAIAAEARRQGIENRRHNRRTLLIGTLTLGASLAAILIAVLH